MPRPALSRWCGSSLEAANRSTCSRLTSRRSPVRAGHRPSSSLVGRERSAVCQLPLFAHCDSEPTPGSHARCSSKPGTGRQRAGRSNCVGERKRAAVPLGDRLAARRRQAPGDTGPPGGRDSPAGPNARRERTRLKRLADDERRGQVRRRCAPTAARRRPPASSGRTACGPHRSRRTGGRRGVEQVPRTGMPELFGDLLRVHDLPLLGVGELRAMTRGAAVHVEDAQ